MRRNRKPSRHFIRLLEADEYNGSAVLVECGQPGVFHIQRHQGSIRPASETEVRELTRRFGEAKFFDVPSAREPRKIEINATTKPRRALGY